MEEIGVRLDGESQAPTILTLERDQVSIAQWAGWAPGQLWGNSASLRFNPRTIQPVARCYTDGAIPAHRVIVLIINI
jgi:hypothetical protein